MHGGPVLCHPTIHGYIDNFLTVQIHYTSKVEPSYFCWNIDNITNHFLRQLICSEVAVQYIWYDRKIVPGVCSRFVFSCDLGMNPILFRNAFHALMIYRFIHAVVQLPYTCLYSSWILRISSSSSWFPRPKTKITFLPCIITAL